jgi:hypothetical protein
LKSGKIDLGLFRPRPARQLLGLDPEVAQITQQAGEYLEVIPFRKITIDEHDRRVKRGHVTVEDMVGYALKLHIGEPPHHFSAFLGSGDGAAAVKVLPEEEGIDLGGVAPERDILIAVGKDLCLNKITRGEEF